MASHAHVDGDGPGFFKVILAKTLRKKKLGIPVKFCREHGETLSNPVMFLELSTGLKWRVELKTASHGHKVWFKQGWHEFAQYCDLATHFILVFRYVGNSTFYTLVFGGSQTEIEYHSSNITEMKSDDDSVSVEILDHLPSLEREQVKSSTSPTTRSCPRQMKKKEKMSTSPKSYELKHGKREGGRKKVGKSRVRILGRDKVEAIVRATSHFQSDKPFFEVLMNPSKVGGCFNMNVPRLFIRKSIKEKTDEATLIKVSNGKQWPLTCYWGEDKNGSATLKLHGWKEVVADNQLKVGDVCVFELVPSNKLCFHLTIFPLSFPSLKEIGGNRDQA